MESIRLKEIFLFKNRKKTKINDFATILQNFIFHFSSVFKIKALLQRFPRLFFNYLFFAVLLEKGRRPIPPPSLPPLGDNILRGPKNATMTTQIAQFVPGQRSTAEKAHPMGKQRKKQQIGRSRGRGQSQANPWPIITKLGN